MKELIFGSNKVTIKNFEKIIYNFDIVYRLNLNSEYTEENNFHKDIYYLNNHVYKYVYMENKPIDELKELYKDTNVDYKYINILKNIFKNKLYNMSS